MRRRDRDGVVEGGLGDDVDRTINGKALLHLCLLIVHCVNGMIL